MKKRIYTEEFKQEAIQLAIQTGNTTQTAKKLGIPEATLHTWVSTTKLESVPAKHLNGNANSG